MSTQLLHTTELNDTAKISSDITYIHVPEMLKILQVNVKMDWLDKFSFATE